MKENRTKRLLRSNKPVLGTFCYIPSPWVVEIAALAGFDYVTIDLEHAGKDIQTVESMVVAAEARSITPIVRVPSADEKLIGQVLETGAQGIMIPLVDNAETAARAVHASKYNPDGTRGVCRSARAAEFGMTIPHFAEFARKTNEEILVVAMIEDKTGVKNIQSIVESGVDAILLGPADLSASLGVMGNVDHPLVTKAVEDVTRVVLANGNVSVGNLCFSGDDIERWFRLGHRIFSYGVDTGMLARSYQAAGDLVRKRLQDCATSGKSEAKSVIGAAYAPLQEIG